MDIVSRLFISILLAQAPDAGVEKKIHVPDRILTPGVIDEAVTQDNIQRTICVPGYAAEKRNVTAGAKTRSVKKYLDLHPDWPKCKPVGDEKCEIDHLISLELGGKNDEDNLWPQLYCPAGTGGKTCFGATEKDHVENYLHKQICSGKITLAAAQKAIADDWYAVYLEWAATR